MISIIVSSHQSEFLKALSENIAQSIGVEYELITIQNNARYSICEAYNMGVQKSKYDFLCFVHEDLIFETMNWGQKLISIIQADSNIGLIGVAGTKYKSSYPSGWGQSPLLKKFKRGHIYQKTSNGTDDFIYMDFDVNTDKTTNDEVVCIDGVFMFTKRTIFNTCQFDEILFTHFHGYDIDFSLQVLFNHHKVIVSREILIYHYSSGNYDKNNTIANRAVVKKWKKKLPVSTKDTSLSKLKLNFLNIYTWMYFLILAFQRKIKNDK